MPFKSIAAFTADLRVGVGSTEARIGGVIANVLARARADDSLHHIYTQLLDARAAEAARALSAASCVDPRTPLLGVPVVIKDNIDLAGSPTSCGRRVRVAAAIASAAIVTRLESLGAIVIGKTNLDEAALGASGRNPRFGRCGNPRFPDRLSGGSSSGSAAAVAAGHALLGIGTDTLGSVRIPAAFCGVVGFKPSHGRLSTAGIAPLYPRFDSVGLLAASIADIRHVAGLMLGEHGAAQNAARRVAVLIGGALAAAEPEVARGYRHCVARLEGYHEFTVGAAPPLDWTATARAAVWEVAHEFAERSASRAPGYHPADDIDGDLGRLLSQAARLPAETLLAGRALLAESASKLEDCLEHADAILTPTCPQGAPRIDEHPAKTVPAFTTAANLAGLPAVAWSQRLTTGDTLSLQLIGRSGEDLRLLNLASIIQAATSADSPH